ncbi:MAG: hypothetical protein H6765_04640 [Candidatus Peribacteria bacterium]|nr:MAG: hypothetical protein H6765_04640 [Candidatus Peribacteria bacterium]
MKNDTASEQIDYAQEIGDILFSAFHHGVLCIRQHFILFVGDSNFIREYMVDVLAKQKIPSC